MSRFIIVLTPGKLRNAGFSLGGLLKSHCVTVFCSPAGGQKPSTRSRNRLTSEPGHLKKQLAICPVALEESTAMIRCENYEVSTDPYLVIATQRGIGKFLGIPMNEET